MGEAIANGATRNLYLGGLPPATQVEHLHMLFKPFGTIESVRVMRHHGTGYVNFCSVEAAINARNHFMNAKARDFLPGFNGPEAETAVQVTFTSAQQNCRRRAYGPGGKGDMPGGGKDLSNIRTYLKHIIVIHYCEFEYWSNRNVEHPKQPNSLPSASRGALRLFGLFVESPGSIHARSVAISSLMPFFPKGSIPFASLGMHLCHMPRTHNAP